MINDTFLDITIHLFAALVIGSLIGLERTFSGRPAGFRTHALVCVASALLMLVTSYQSLWLTHLPMEAVRTDPTRMAQGIMTGIGFLGAGVIFKEGLTTVRGLTTAASIWMTAAIGILIGIGFYFPAILATVITLSTLSLFRLFEKRFPARHFANLVLRFRREDVLPEAQLRERLKANHVSLIKAHYYLRSEGTIFEYRMVVMTLDKRNLEQLSEQLMTLPQVYEFHLGAIAE